MGPAWQGHLDADSFTRVDQRGARPLLAADRADLAVLAATCDAREWEASAVDHDRPLVFGCMADGRLVAAGTLASWRDRLEQGDRAAGCRVARPGPGGAGLA